MRFGVEAHGGNGGFKGVHAFAFSIAASMAASQLALPSFGGMMKSRTRPGRVRYR
jgi:hypothetical protein